MKCTRMLPALAIAVGLASVPVAGQSQPPAARKVAVKPYTSPRTPWGDPDLKGIYTNKDESGIPIERPGQFEGKKADDVDESEFAEILRQRAEAAVARAPLAGGETGAGPVHWYENYNVKNSRAWLVVDPPDGRIPPPSAEAAQRAAALAAARGARGPADAAEDRSLYDRCITRGLPGSMLPAIYGNSYQIVQAPGYVAIRYEMVHETRLIPLDSRPHAGSSLRFYMGDARGHWEGKALVIETTNFTDKTNYRGASKHLRMV